MSARYEIDIPHFYQLEYRENGRVMLVEIDFRDSVIYLEESLITLWQAPYENDAVSPADRSRIIENINRYLVNERGFKNVRMIRE